MNKPIYVNTNSQGISEDGLPTYSQDNGLIRGERVEVKPWWRYSDGAEMQLELSYEEHINSKKHCIETEDIYLAVNYDRQVAIKEEIPVTQIANPNLYHIEILSSAQPVKEGEGAQLNIGDTSITKLIEGCVQVVTKNGCIELYPDEVEAFNKFTQPVTPPASKEVKSAEEILNKHLIDWSAIEDADFSQIHSAMQEFAEAYAAQHQQSEGMVEVEIVRAFLQKIASMSTSASNEQNKSIRFEILDFTSTFLKSAN